MNPRKPRNRVRYTPAREWSVYVRVDGAERLIDSKLTEHEAVDLSQALALEDLDSIIRIEGK